jgi:hypothetical protein
MANKMNIGKGNDAFKIGEDGTIIRIDTPNNSQPNNQNSLKNNDWILFRIWFLLITMIAGGIVMYYINN